MDRRVVGVLALLALVAPPPPAAAQDGPPVSQTFDWWESEGISGTTPWGQAVDTAATRLIRSWTTLPEYTNGMVDHIPDDPTVGDASSAQATSRRQGGR